MAVPGLQPHIDFQEAPEPRLINRKTGGALLVTPAEAQLLRAWDGSTSATRLSSAVFMSGLDVDPWHVEQFFRRLERLGCLAVPRPAIPNFVGPSPGISKLEDKVPSLRGDLLIEKAPGSRSVFHVKDPKSKRAFSLFDVEVSVARMLDGKRQAKDVIENAARLGIEVTLDSLQQFTSHLKSYRFIDQGIRDGESTWPVRTPWSDEDRQLYQSSMKNLREGHFAQARSFAESLEASGPAKEEARELKHRVEVAAEGVFELVGTFGEMHATVVPPAKAEPAPPISVPVPIAAVAKTPAGPATPVARRRTGLLAAGGVGVVVLVGLLRPVPVVTDIACELEVETLGVPRTMRGGKVATHVESGTHVEKGAVVARLGTGETIAELEAKQHAVEATLAAVPPATSGQKVVLARANLKKAQGEVEKARKKGWKLPVRDLDAARKSLDALTHEFTRGALETELKSLRDRKVALEAELSRSIVIAPVAGVFVGVGALPEELFANETYGQIVGPTFKLVTKAPLPEGVDSALFRSPGYEVELGLSEGKPVFPVRPAFVGAKGTLTVTSGHAPWIVARIH